MGRTVHADDFPVIGALLHLQKQFQQRGSGARTVSTTRRLASDDGALRACASGAQVPALAVRVTVPMISHRFRGSHHDTTLIDHAMYARDERIVIEIQSAAGSASMHK